MKNYWDWERIADDVRRTVQNAVDSADFRSLNQNITDTINRAAGGFRNAGKKESNQSYRYNSNTENQSERAWANVDLDKLQHPTLYMRTKGKKVTGMALALTGYITGGIFLLGFILTGLAELFIGVNAGVNLALSVLGLFSLIGFTVGLVGSKILGRVKRFRAYVQQMRGREYCNIKELARSLRKKEKFVKKDLEWMIEKGWFIQGYLDDDNTCLITSREAYDEYRRLMIQREEQKKREQEEAIKRQNQNLSREQEMAEKRRKMDPQIHAVLETGNAYIKKLRECNDAIPGEVISAKISRMELLTKRIFERVEQDPDAVEDIRKMMEYYLPTAVKLLEAYENLDGQPIQRENIVSSKKEIEDTIDTLNTAFEKLLDDLFQETAWDVSADISVLKTMLAQEGLTEEDFKTGGKK